ncbi:hypothetical protein SAMN04487910_4064 [Aquimarina amphilecti]|uniref:Uncharacterized protein n=1 Tax=Aquimarina amphilecti TaxID=1038014 RepID=A0A1H7VFG4_AQUAM|nr:hypothetical protein [Aquimarina amphilecti]SEM07517.1 hypothetical protein SAMN04487910_4064 [Aquimarina amphilecti]
MKNYILLLLFAFICCKSESKPANELKDTEINATQMAEDLSPETESTNTIIATKTYVIEQNNANGNYSQNLSISWISDNTVEYTLTWNNSSCKKTIKGRANSIKPEKEPFMSSYKGVSFEVTKYKDSKSDYSILLQLDSTSKDKAVVELTSTADGDNEDCRPESVVMVEQK